MELKKNFSRILNFITAISVITTTGILLLSSDRDTFAEGNTTDMSTFGTDEARFVTFHDGKNKLTVKTESRTVKEALDRANIVLNAGDIVEPGLESEVNADGYHINIYRARPVIVKDGTADRYIMTASQDYKSIAQEAGFAVYDGDEISMVASTSFLETGATNTYEITRNGGRTLTVEEEVPFTERIEQDASLPNGQSEVRQLGEIGAKRVKYNVLYIDNKEVSREIVDEEIIRAPVERIVAVGIKKSIPPEWEECANWARQAGVSEVDLSAALDLIYRESGCRVDAANASGAYGIPQALPGSKMASAGTDWQTNPVTQIRWMIGYVTGRYGGWNEAIEYWYSHGWY